MSTEPAHDDFASYFQNDMDWIIALCDAKMDKVLASLPRQTAVEPFYRDHQGFWRVTCPPTRSETIAFCFDDRSGTYLDNFGSFNLNMERLAKMSKIRLIEVGYAESIGVIGYRVFDNGKVVEAYHGGDSEFFDPRAADGKERQWDVASDGSSYLYRSRGASTPQTQSMDFDERITALADDLGLVIPPRIWLVDDENDESSTMYLDPSVTATAHIVEAVLIQ